MNFQYVRGFPADNTKELIADYLTSVVEKPFYYDEFKFRLFLGSCVDDSSFIVFPQIFWFPETWLELRMGLVLASGDLDTKFGQFGDDIAFFDRISLLHQPLDYDAGLDVLTYLRHQNRSRHRSCSLS